MGILPDHYEDACLSCKNRKTCTATCFFVEKYLREDNRPVFEKNEGDDRILARPRSQEVRESDMIRSRSDGESYNEADSVFSTEADSPFRANNYELERTQIFIRHFIDGESYEDLAEV